MPSFGGQRIANRRYSQNVSIRALTLPEAAGADGTVTYSLSPAAPAGLTFSASARTLSGRPTGNQSATAYTYTATDGAGGETATLTFTIAVELDSAPLFAGTVGALAFSQGLEMVLQLPKATGGDGRVRYTLRPRSLPPGLSYSSLEQRVEGTPTATQSATTYTWTATDDDGDTASLTFTIEVEANTAPSFGDQTIADQTWTRNVETASSEGRA